MKRKIYKFNYSFIAIVLLVFAIACDEIEYEGTVLDAPIAEFELTDTSDIGLNGQFAFINKHVNGAEHFWDFGDGNVSEEVEPSHSYTELGFYTVTLTVRNGQKGSYLTDEYSQTYEVTNVPYVRFTTNTDAQKGKPHTFVNKSARVTSYFWDFGYEDAEGVRQTSTEENPIHSFTEGGKFTVTLTAKNDAGEEAVWTEEITVIAPLVEGLFDEETTTLPEGWMLIDGGTVGRTWYVATSFAYYDHVRILGYSSVNPDGVDDWLITPQFTYDGSASLSFDFSQRTSGFSPAVPVEVRISKTGTEASDFTILVGTIVQDVPGTFDYFTKTFDLSGIVSEGEEVYIGFHVNSTGAYTQLDNIIVF